MESYNYCNGCKKSLLISNFDKKNDNENYYSRCKSCRKIHNKNEKKRYIKKICSIRKLCNNNCLVCFERSFASFKGKTNNNNLKIDCFDVIKNNNLTPRNIFKSSNKKYWFKCDDKNCGHSFIKNISKITNNNSWCPYCTNKKLCDSKECISCFNKSFASFKKKTKNGNLIIDYWDKEKNNNLTSRNIFKSSNKKYWFKCDDKNCNHFFNSSIANITRNNNGQWCPFCANTKLCDDKECISCFNNSFASFKGMINTKLKIDCFNIKKNEITPRHIFKGTKKKYIFDCNVCNHSFNSALHNITKKNFTWCPHCKNKTELKLYNWLLKKDFIIKIEREFSPIWCSTKYIFLKNNKIENGKYQYRYDFLLVFKNGKKLIIELHGCQHFKKVWNWKGPFLQQIRDKYKERKATQKGIKVITCIQEDVWKNKNNWDKKLLKILKTI